MPIEFTPSRRLLDAYLRLRERLRGQKPQANSIKDGTVSAVNDDGSYTVDGRALFAVGNAAITAGEKVDVAWKDGRPKVILAHNARRAQFVPPLGETILGCVEELFLPDFGNDRRVWFRNGTDFRPILFDQSTNNLRNIAGQIIQVDEVFWGRFSSNHFVLIGRRDSDTFHAIAVYRINRPRDNEPFPPGFNIKAVLVRLYILEDPAGPSFGTISASNGAGTATNPLRAFSSAGIAGNVISPGPFANFSALVTTSIICQAVYQGVCVNGDVLIRMNVNTSVSISGPNVGQDTFYSATVGTLIANLTRGTVLAEHAPDRFSPLFVRAQNSVSPPNPLTYACFGITGGSTVSVSHNTGERGDATVVSVKMVGPPDALVPTLNQYLLVEHDDQSADGTSGGGFENAKVCYPGSGDAFSAAIFRLVGEFEQVITNSLSGGGILTAQRVNFQASHTHVFWAKIANNNYLPSPILNLIDLRKSENAEIGNQPVLVLMNVGNIPQFPLRQMVAVRSGLIYAPQGPGPVPPATPVPPFNVQFFVRGDTKPGATQIAQTDLKKNTGLQKQATLKAVKLPAQVLIVQSEDGDLHSLNSTSLGPARTALSI